MQTAGGGFAAAITSHDQLVDYKMSIGFPVSVPSYYQDVTKCVVSVDLNESVTTQLPDGTTLISGYPSASMRVVLAGMLNQAPGVAMVEADTIHRLMNPNDSASAMWRLTCGGLPITWQAGLWDGASSADLVTKYTGTLDKITCSNGVVTLTCRDQRSTITNPAALPPVVTQPPYNAALTSEFAIDSLARHASPSQYYSWPAPHTNSVLAIGFRSSIWPEVGSLYPGFAQGPVFMAGAYGTCLAPTSLLTAYSLAAPVLTTDKLCGHFITSADGLALNINDDPSTYQIAIQRAAGTIFLESNSPSGQSFASFAVSGTVEVEFSVAWAASSTSVTGTMWLNGVSHAISFTAKDARPVGRSFTICAVTGPIEGLQITTESSYASRYPFAPTLLIDAGGSLNSLTALPDVNGKDSWSVLQDIASAEAAVIGFDELGRLRFVNRNTIRTMASVRSITSTDSLVALDTDAQMALCATHVQIPVNALTVQAPGNAWISPDVTAVPANSIVQRFVNTDTIVLNVATADSGFWIDGGTIGLTYFRACTTADGTGATVKTGIRIWVEQLSAKRLRIAIVNSNGFAVYLCNPVEYGGVGSGNATGQGFIVIGGQKVTSVNDAQNNGITAPGSVVVDEQWPILITNPPLATGEVTTSGGATTNTQFGDILLPLPANDWVQNSASADTMALFLIRDLHYPKPQYRNVTIIPDPRLQLLDRVTLVDPDVSQVNDDALIVGITTALRAGTYQQNIDARAVHRPGDWVLGLVGRSELGSTTYLY